MKQLYRHLNAQRTICFRILIEPSSEDIGTVSRHENRTDVRIRRIQSEKSHTAQQSGVNTIFCRKNHCTKSNCLRLVHRINLSDLFTAR
jgi:hypothetical protein